jgi:hypothetical protein
MPSLEGQFKRLDRELKELCHTFGVEMEYIHELMEKVGCSKKELKNALMGQNYAAWTTLEDMAIQSGQEK